MKFNTIAYVLLVLVFVIAVVYTNKEGGNHFDNGHQKMGLAMLIMASVQVLGDVCRPHPPAPNSGEDKSNLRKDWEIGQLVLGVALLASAFWQMGKGIELYAIKYSVSESDEEKLGIAYWVWIGVMSAVIVVGAGYFRYPKSSGKKPGKKVLGKMLTTPYSRQVASGTRWLPKVLTQCSNLEDGTNKAGDV